MAQRTVTVRYNNLRGVDFSRPASLVDNSRSPYCVNMMPDTSLSPVKRPGWEKVYNLAGEVYNIWFCTISAPNQFHPEILCFRANFIKTYF